MPSGIYEHKGHKFTEEARRKISESNKGQKRSEKTKQRLSESHRGQIPWMKGKHHSEKSKQKNSMAHQGKKHSEETKQKMSGRIAWNKDIPMTEDMKRILSMANIGRKPHLGFHHSKEVRKKISKALKDQIVWNKGKKCPHLSGSKSNNWKGGVTKLNYDLRLQPEYQLWRKSIFIRDNFTCQICGINGGRLAVHHINNFADFPELRLAIDNGITLCKNCHKRFHKIFGNKNNTKEQLKDFSIFKE